MQKESFPTRLRVQPEEAGRRLDQYLAVQLTEVSRARVQQLIRQGKVEVNGAPAKASLRLKGNETVTLLGPAQAPPLRAVPEDIPLDVVYEDETLAVVSKPAGMMVHAGAGRVDEARNRGTLVNALLHHLATLSGVGGELRPGIVHRLDKQTSGLMVVAKDDAAHRKLAAQFAQREVHKKYVALVHGWVRREEGAVEQAIARDRVRRTRMTTRRSGGRAALSRYRVLERLETPWGRFTLLEVTIATGRTHQIRVHLASLGHPVVGDALYGAPRQLRSRDGKSQRPTLARNFLHAAALEFTHPRSGKPLSFSQPLPPELEEFLAGLRAHA
ncbi:MAG: RluA family pseudouridine synthase [Terriglobales bacterium]